MKRVRPEGEREGGKRKKKERKNPEQEASIHHLLDDEERSRASRPRTENKPSSAFCCQRCSTTD